MTPNDPQRHHESVWELLPWYANGTLSAREAALVEDHLPQCVACQQELKQCGSLAAVAKSTSVEKEDVWTPSPRHFAEVLSRVEAAHAGATGDWRSLAKLRSWFLATPSPMRWGFALQGALIVALTSALIVQTAMTPPQLYETLSRESQQAGSDRARLRMVFADDITGKELGDLLRDIEATMVAGPSPQGVYTVEISLAASEHERAKAVQARASAHPKVRFVALAPPGSSP